MMINKSLRNYIGWQIEDIKQEGWAFDTLIGKLLIVHCTTCKTVYCLHILHTLIQRTSQLDYDKIMELVISAIKCHNSEISLRDEFTVYYDR